MASYTYDRDRKRARIFFRLGSRQYNKVERAADERSAQRMAAVAEDAVVQIEAGRLTVPPGCDVKLFVLSGGKAVRSLAAAPGPENPTTLKSLFEIYFGALTAGSKAENSIATERIHGRHLRRLLGDARKLDRLDVAGLQRYVGARAGEGVARDTTKKELKTLRLVLTWAAKRGLVPGPPDWSPGELTLPKGTEKPPFQIRAQIEARIARGGLSPEAEAQLWESLWLDRDQTLEFLASARANSRPPFQYPLLAFAAYTRARRSEMLRSEPEDWDLGAGVVQIRQMKPDRSRNFTRRSVPVHRDLAAVMAAWLAVGPRGRLVFCGDDGSPVKPDGASWHFRRLVVGGPWSVLHGFHVFRHSIASNLAAAETDQRLIDGVLGHSTDQMSRRYRHLLPADKRSAIDRLF
ncbi:tyrosine-type recombinase/integrase [Paludisphaera soli]|uniref:tyrosine-type recombinase/integrase n=1 Tax=Paludisphaera soli TaxID=2712865 RepID=UPI0013EDD489|nr:tyrosine-type recombinase/integrase [Paludisphaera soli]